MKNNWNDEHSANNAMQSLQGPCEGSLYGTYINSAIDIVVTQHGTPNEFRVAFCF